MDRRDPGIELHARSRRYLRELTDTPEMEFHEHYPDFAAIEASIERARIERSAYMADLLSSAMESIAQSVRRLVATSNLDQHEAGSER